MTASSKDKTIFRIVKDKDNPYVMMDKRPIEKPYLSWKAKGILSYLLSRPDDWEIHLQDLVSRSTDGDHATRSGVKELIQVGHIERIYEREKGKIKRVILKVHEQPLRGFQQVDNPQVEKPQVDNRPLNNTDHTKTKRTKKESSSDIPPALFALPGFVKTWAEWVKYRKEIGKALKDTTIEKQFAFLLENKPEAVAILEQSMTQGWQGLFKLKKTGYTKTQPAQVGHEPTEAELEATRAAIRKAQAQAPIPDEEIF